jgi:hypothetical protein
MVLRNVGRTPGGWAKVTGATAWRWIRHVTASGDPNPVLPVAVRRGRWQPPCRERRRRHGGRAARADGPGARVRPGHRRARRTAVVDGAGRPRLDGRGPAQRGLPAGAGDPGGARGRGAAAPAGGERPFPGPAGDRAGGARGDPAARRALGIDRQGDPRPGRPAPAGGAGQRRPAAARRAAGLAARRRPPAAAAGRGVPAGAAGPAGPHPHQHPRPPRRPGGPGHGRLLPRAPQRTAGDARLGRLPRRPRPGPAGAAPGGGRAATGQLRARRLGLGADRRADRLPARPAGARLAGVRAQRSALAGRLVRRGRRGLGRAAAWSPRPASSPAPAAHGRPSSAGSRRCRRRPGRRPRTW